VRLTLQLHQLPACIAGPQRLCIHSGSVSDTLVMTNDDISAWRRMRSPHRHTHSPFLNLRGC
jgi:hypothetical protein